MRNKKDILLEVNESATMSRKEELKVEVFLDIRDLLAEIVLQLKISNEIQNDNSNKN